MDKYAKFRHKFVGKEVHGFSGYTRLEYSDGQVDTYIPGRRSHSNLGRQCTDPGVAWYGAFYNPETGKWDIRSWAVRDDSFKITLLTEEEHATYVITGHGNYHTHHMKPGVPFFTLRNNTETGLREGTWALSDESGNITFLTDEEKENYVKNYNDGKSKDEQEERD